MSEPMTLEDVLEGKEPVVEPEAPEEAKQEEEPQEAQSVEEAEPVAEVEADPAEGVKEEPEPPAGEKSKEVPLAALLDERDKRKELEKKVHEFEKQTEEQKEKIDFWENPEGALKQMRDEIRTEFATEFTNRWVSFSLENAAYRHDDFDQMKTSFAEAAEQNPALAQQAMQAADPGEYIYTVGKQFQQLDSAGGDIDALRERIRNEERAKIMEEMNKKQEALGKVPTPITDETSAAAPREKAEGGATPLENIFTRNN